MDEHQWLADRFEANRAQLRAVAYRMLGSVSEADDAVQEAWLRLSRTDTSGVENLGAWLTTVTARISLDMLRARASRREEPLEARIPVPAVTLVDDPEQQALLADSVGVALLVVLETLSPAERLAFVLHDMFAVPFDDIAPIIDRSPTAARQLASRARRRVRGAPAPDRDLARQREIVDAFLAAARDGDFETLLEVLDPEVVLRVDRRRVTRVIRGAEAVIAQASTYVGLARLARPALVNGGAGFVVTGRAVAGFTIVGDRIVEIDIFADHARLRGIDGATADTERNT